MVTACWACRGAACKGRSRSVRRDRASAVTAAGGSCCPGQSLPVCASTRRGDQKQLGSVADPAEQRALPSEHSAAPAVRSARPASSPIIRRIVACAGLGLGPNSRSLTTADAGHMKRPGVPHPFRVAPQAARSSGRWVVISRAATG
jgi:hypothetical protein